MLKRRVKITFTVLFLFSSLTVFSQNDEAQTLEDAFLGFSTSPEAQVQSIRGLIDSHDRSSSEQALRNIREMMDNTPSTFPKENPEMMQAMGDLASSGTDYVVRSAGRVVNDFPLVRTEACYLLGRVGTPEAKIVLRKVLVNEQEPIVLAEAVLGIAKCGADDEDIQAILFKMRQVTSSSQDSYFADFALSALTIILTNDNEALVRNPGIFVQVNAIVNEARYNIKVRERAENMISILSGGAGG